MITIKNSFAQEKMAIAGSLLAQLFEKLYTFVQPGMTTHAVDAFIENYLTAHKLKSSSKGYLGYKHVSCISVNDEVVHGVPRETTVLALGDLIKIDICASYDGYCADMARSFVLGAVDKAVADFIQTGQSALDKGIAAAQEGARLSDISAAVQQEVESHGYGVVREFAGHGIGKKMHEDPEILNYGKRGCGPVIRAGMAFAIEPMITMGDYKIFLLPDGWTAKTVDKSLAVHVEDTIIITNNGPVIITRLQAEELRG
ncbi:type I methionyl aminopeptidase [Candidatus Dependentiae bacterium]|nr:type I methionyl aminopeptidase [Candidatus Dependentiae bacterium]